MNAEVVLDYTYAYEYSIQIESFNAEYVVQNDPAFIAKNDINTILVLVGPIKCIGGLNKSLA